MSDFNNRNDSFYNDSQNSNSLSTQDSYSSQTYYSEELKEKKGRTSKMIAAAMVCSVVLSGAAGFGGGLLASRFAENGSVSDVPLVDNPSSNSTAVSGVSSSPEMNSMLNDAVGQGIFGEAQKEKLLPFARFPYAAHDTKTAV